MALDKLEIVSEILQANQDIITFDESKFIATRNINLLQKSCIENNIGTEKTGNILTLKLKSFISPNLVYFDELKTKFESNIVDEEFSILKTNGEYCYHSTDSIDLTFSDNASDTFKNICINIYSYFKLYNFLKSTKFADHHNDANTEIVTYSSAKGIFKIKYNPVPELNFKENISSNVSKILETVTPIQLRSFFKNSLFSFSNNTDSISIDDIIIKADEIISAANRDFDLVSKQFDFDTFRDSLYKEKEKYFNNIRDIINKIFSQAVGIPVSISAAVFASYKVSDDTLMLLLVMLSFIVYVAFYVRIQLVYKADIAEIQNDFKADFDIIISKSGLPQPIISAEKLKIERKISSSLTIVNYLIGIVMGLGLLVCLYILYEIGKSETICLFKLLINFFK